jgi:hypothetical protein
MERGKVILLSRVGRSIGEALHVLCTHCRCGRSRAPSVYIAEFQRRQCHPPRHSSNNFPASHCTHQKCEFHLSKRLHTNSVSTTNSARSITVKKTKELSLNISQIKHIWSNWLHDTCVPVTTTLRVIRFKAISALHEAALRPSEHCTELH